MNKVILIVEDEADLRHTLARTLELEGYEVVEAANGDEAIRRLRDGKRQRPNMILMDLMMPGMDGWSLRTELLKDPLLAQIPVVVLSGGTNVPRVARSLRAAAYLEKPFNMDTFVRVVREHWLDDARQAAADEAIINTMSGAVQRLTALIESLLQRAPIIGDRLMVSLETLDATALVREVIDEHRPAALARDIDLQLTAPDDLPPLRGDRRIVKLVLGQLIHEAIRSMEGGSIEVLLRHDMGAHHLGVRDRAPLATTPSAPAPVTAATATTSPTPTATSATSDAPSVPAAAHRTTVPGVGMGLSLLREILATINGRIELHSDLERGHAFVLVLPELEAHRHDPESTYQHRTN